MFVFIAVRCAFDQVLWFWLSDCVEEAFNKGQLHRRLCIFGDDCQFVVVVVVDVGQGGVGLAAVSQIQFHIVHWFGASGV